MAIGIKFDLNGNPEPPAIILANKNGNKLGQLNVNANSIELVDKLNDAAEISFTVNKFIDNEITPLWDKIVNFKLVWCKEWNEWFEITVELDEETETVKTVFGTQLGQAELSQLMLHDVEINTEDDIARDDYKINILYNAEDPEASILNRLLRDKAPHYTIAYVSPTIAKIQRSFSFNDISIYDAFLEIAEEIGCLFRFYADTDDNGVFCRKIAVFDLEQNCNSCGHRGEYTDKCPKCNSTNIKNGYGEDTTIFVTADELATEGIELKTDTDSVKNCFKLEAGDDLMTATIRNCNPNGTDYLWYFSSAMKEDMSKELVDKIEFYDKLYKQYYNDYHFDIDTGLLNQYNSLVTKYSVYNEELEKINTPIQGYSSLMNVYYNTIDLGLYLKSNLMPSVTMSETSAVEQARLLTASHLSPIAVANIKSVSLATANSTVLSLAKILVRSTYKVEIKSSQLSEDKQTWTGNFVVTNYSDEEDTATSAMVSVTINGDEETFAKQKIDKALNKENADNLSISGLFEKEYIDFCTELKKYALNPLISFRDACQACIDILIEQGITDNNSWSDDTEGSESNLYEKLYLPYYNKLQAIESEIKIRENEINIVTGLYNTDGKLVTEGLQTIIEKKKSQIQEALNFEKYLGRELWSEFCLFRRDSKYSNENYISDGLNNAELFKNALEFFKTAENEIYKSAELQHSISATLNNLLAIPKFKDLVDYFEVGNWIRIRIDDEIYKLRLLEYGVDFGDFNNISVEFSDVTKVKNGITDIQSVLSQASSMATSYSSIQKQADKGSAAKGTLDEWLSKGLNSAVVRIQSNNNEEVTLSKNGLLCRSYDDITETHSPEQFKLTHNIMAYTTDEWKTVKQAIGKHDYVVYDEDSNEFVDRTGYGVTSDFLAAGIVSGSQIIGGDIYSSNYAIGIGAKGTHINLKKGDFDFAGGKIVFDTDSDILTLKNVTIEWANINKPDVKDVSGLGEYLDEINKDILNAETNAKDYADRKDEELSKTLTSNYEDYANTQDGLLSKTLTEAYQTYSDSKVSALDNAVSKYFGLDGTTLIGDSYLISPYIAGGYLNITGKDNNLRVLVDPNDFTGNGYALQVFNGNLKKVVMGVDGNGNAIFNGDVTATSLTLGENVYIAQDKITGLKESFAKFDSDILGVQTRAENAETNAKNYADNQDAALKSNLTLAYETYTNSKIGELDTAVSNYLGLDGETIIGGQYLISPYIAGGYLNITNTENNSRVLIDPNNLTNNNYIFQVYNGNEVTVGIDNNGNAEFAGVIKAKKGGTIGGFNIGDNGIEYSDLNASEYVYVGTDGISLGNEGVFYVTNGGYLCALAANITGTIYANSGTIGGCEISNGYLQIDGAHITNGTIDSARIGVLDFNHINGDQLDVSNATISNCTIESDCTILGKLSVSNIESGTSSADITFDGNLVANNISVKGGTIGGFTINEWSISSTQDNGNSIYISPNYIIAHGDEGSVTLYSGGYLVADNATINNATISNSDFENITITGLDSRITVGDSELYEVSIDYTGWNLYQKESGVNYYGRMTAAILELSNPSIMLTCQTAITALPSGQDNAWISAGGATIYFSSSGGRLSGTWSGTSSVATTSDETKKNSIATIPDKYDVFFDALNPSVYKYNDGTSGRIHTGYTTQGVLRALNAADIPTNDFAGYVMTTSYDKEKDEVETFGCLRYEEFIALNTWQIQKLKTRISELEKKLALNEKNE